jgi:hypothetical protein
VSRTHRVPWSGHACVQKLPSGEGSFDSVDGALDQGFQRDFLRVEAVEQTAFADSCRSSVGVEREGGGT